VAAIGSRNWLQGPGSHILFPKITAAPIIFIAPATQQVARMLVLNNPQRERQLRYYTPWSESASELYRPWLVGEVSAHFLRIKGATWSV
jgi:hypothetical protein